MKGKVTILQDDALRFAAACEIADVTLKDNRVVGDSVKIVLDYAKLDDIVKVGSLIATKAGLSAGAKPTPAEVKEKPAKAAK